MAPRCTTFARRRVAYSACVGLILMGGAWRASIGTPAARAASGNAGDVKISAYPYPEHGNEGNDPHVPCQFYLLGFNMAASSGTAAVDGWPPTGDGAQVLKLSYTTQPDGTFIAGPYGLSAGHYKINVTDNKGNDILKHKVFWVDTCASSAPTATPVPPANTATATPILPTDVPTETATPVPPTSTETAPAATPTSTISIGIQ
jgi:hypothetical protein